MDFDDVNGINARSGPGDRFIGLVRTIGHRKDWGNDAIRASMVGVKADGVIRGQDQNDAKPRLSKAFAATRLKYKDELDVVLFDLQRAIRRGNIIVRIVAAARCFITRLATTARGIAGQTRRLNVNDRRDIDPMSLRPLTSFAFRQAAATMFAIVGRHATASAVLARKRDGSILPTSSRNRNTRK